VSEIYNLEREKKQSRSCETQSTPEKNHRHTINAVNERANLYLS